MPLTQDDIVKRLLPARKKGETQDWAVIGQDPDTPSDPFDAGNSETDPRYKHNAIWVTINGNPDAQIAYFDPSLDVRLLQWGTRVKIRYEDGKAWIDRADRNFLTAQQSGAPLPTGNMPIPEHDHTSADEGGTLGADTVDTTQIVDSAVTTAKINDLAVTTGKLADTAVTTAKITDANVTLAKMANNSVDTSQIVDDAVTPTKTDGLTGSSVAFVTQTASNTFSSIDYSLSTDTRLLYDGTDIRTAFTGQEQPNTTNAVINSGTLTDVIEIAIPETDISNTSTLLVHFEFRAIGSVVGDNFIFRLYYYNGSGYTYYSTEGGKTFETQVAAALNTFVYTFLVDQNALATAPGVDGSNNYLWKIQCFRSSGTGQLTVSLGIASLLRVMEV